MTSEAAKISARANTHHEEFTSANAADFALAGQSLGTAQMSE
jgi:hypothetical protein